MQVQQQISRIFDLVVPLLLYFVWEWSLHYIFLFVYIDALSGACVSYFKERRIELTKNTKVKKSFFNLVKYLILNFLGIILFEFAIMQVHPELNLWDSFVDFLLIKEMGLPQFVLIIPLIALLNYQQYQTLFIKTRAYEFLPLNFLQNNNNSTWMLFALLGLLTFVISLLFKSSPMLVLLVFLAIKAIIDFVLIPFLDRYFVKHFVNSHNDFQR